MKIEDAVNCLLDMREHHVCVYGYGQNGKLVVEFLKNIGIVIEAVCDKNENVQIEGYNFVSFEQFQKLDKKIICIVTPAKGAESEHQKLLQHFSKVVDMKYFWQFLRCIPQENDTWNFENYVPFNHYESPYLNENSREYQYYKKNSQNELKDIELNEEGQIALLKDIGGFVENFYGDISKEKIFSRYISNNDMFDGADAALYYSFLRKFRLQRVIEIGSGHSTALALDVKQHYVNELTISCIEPFPDRLLRNIKSDDEVHLQKTYVQEIDLKIFEALQENDILFIDSSHVAKIGGDVPFEYFEILPRLKKGVLIHIHDIFYPFLYPERWIKQGRCYNEAFILRALLMDSNKYEVCFFNDMMYKLYEAEYSAYFRKAGGSSIWLRKR